MGRLFIGSGADSRVYRNKKASKVFKIYGNHFSKEDIEQYHKIQSIFSKKLGTIEVDSMVGNSESHLLKILDLKKGRVIQGNDSNSPVISVLPYIIGETLAEIYGGDDYLEGFQKSTNLRNLLSKIIDFPAEIDINPMNIKITPSSEIIITDIASEIQSLLNIDYLNN